MTSVIYVCTTVNGEVIETKSYSKAQQIKAEGGSYLVRYEENYTY